ncbi:Hypothetical predicted protein [Scomber scombrus]|uniref:Uncharacterized protein n=1 Tax=Scomber scombrus TaxID=13677 RepID=A0AAV1Q3U9_SCOSC
MAQKDVTCEPWMMCACVSIINLIGQQGSPSHSLHRDWLISKTQLTATERQLGAKKQNWTWKKKVCCRDKREEITFLLSFGLILTGGDVKELVML